MWYRQAIKKPWEMTPEELVDLDYDIISGGHSLTPKSIFGMDRQQIETLYDLSQYEDDWRLNESLGKGWEFDYPANLHLIPHIRQNKPIRIYRASEYPDILPGHYVTELQQYARDHGERSIPDTQWGISDIEVRPSELMTYGDPHEFIYYPESPEVALERLIQNAIKRGERVPGR